MAGYFKLLASGSQAVRQLDSSVRINVNPAPLLFLALQTNSIWTSKVGPPTAAIQQDWTSGHHV